MPWLIQVQVAGVRCWTWNSVSIYGDRQSVKSVILGVRTKCQNHLTDPDVYSTEWSPAKCINLITKGLRAKHQAGVEAVPDLLNDFCRK